MYSPTTIKIHKGKMIILTYITKIKSQNELSGIITATTRKHILFLVNNNKTADELMLPYDKIIKINQPKKF